MNNLLQEATAAGTQVNEHALHFGKNGILTLYELFHKSNNRLLKAAVPDCLKGVGRESVAFKEMERPKFTVLDFQELVRTTFGSPPEKMPATLQGGNYATGITIGGKTPMDMA